jgi:hypothetical protein
MLHCRDGNNQIRLASNSHLSHGLSVQRIQQTWRTMIGDLEEAEGITTTGRGDIEVS